MRVLSRSFFARPAPRLAPDLLGRRIVAHGVTVRITEVEAYAGPADPASHAWRGPTPRTAVMFGPPGHLYVYFSYGVHWCANIVCGRDGRAAAVLLRGGEVLDGVDVARMRRPAARRDTELARGPGRFAAALGLTGADSGADLCVAPFLTPGRRTAADQVASGPRIGISRAVAQPWRFWVIGDPTVSGPGSQAAAGQPGRLGG